MTASLKNYKLVYLWYFVINISLSIGLILIQYLNLDMPKLKNWFEIGICTFGICMLLSLWSSAFIATSSYMGKYIIDSKITKSFTFALIILDGLTLYYVSFGHYDFLKPCVACLIIWILGFGCSIFLNKRFIIWNNQWHPNDHSHTPTENPYSGISS